MVSFPTLEKRSPYFQYLFCHHNLNIEEYYDRRTERNRTLISSANGPLLLVIPTGKIAPADRFYKAIPIAYEEPWQKKTLEKFRI